MKKFNKKGMKDNTPDNSQDKYTHKGFSFKFDNKGLQEEYVKVYEDNKHIELNFPTSNIAYIDAVSIVRGKDRKKIDNIRDTYDEFDANYSKGLIHKYDMFDKVREKYENNFRKQLDKLEQYFELVNEETKTFNEKYPNGKLSNGNERRYNVVWYSKTGQGGHVAV